MKKTKKHIILTSPEEIGRAIRNKRKSSGMNITNAAALCNVGVRFFSELERGKETAEIGKTLQVMKCMGLEMRISARDDLDEA